MKTLLAILGAAALVAALMGTNFAGINPGASEGSIDATLGTGFVAGNRVTDNPIPIIAVRFDDGRDDLVDDGNGTGMYKPFLDLGIPVSLALSYDQLGTAGKATVAQVQTILDEFDAAGVDVEIVHHFDNGLTGAASMTWAELLDECNPSELVSAFGRPVNAAAFPGSPETILFVRRQFAALREALEAGGIEYMDAAYGGPTASTDSIPHTGWHYRDATNVTTPDLGADRALYPGVTDDPYQLPVVQTIDLGNFWVERDLSEEWGNDRYDDWTILADGSGDPVADWEKSFARLYSLYIGNGWGGVWAMHDSAGAADPNYTYDGEFSPHKVAWVLDQLRDAGYIRLGTVSEAYEWALSRWAPGTELVMDKLDFPMFDIGDSSGVEVAWLPGWGTPGSGGPNWAAGVGGGVGNWSAGINAKYDRTGNFPPDLVNTGTLTGYRGKAGAFRHETTNNANRMIVQRGNLPPGRYEFHYAKSGNALTQIRDYKFVLAGKAARVGAAMTAGWVFSDTLLVLRNNTADQSITNNTIPHTVVIPFAVDPAAGMRLSGWESATDLTYGHYINTARWEGGLYIYLAGNDNDLYSNIGIRYIGPLKY